MELPRIWNPGQFQHVPGSLCAADQRIPVEYLPSAFVSLMDGQHYRRADSIVLHFADDFGGQAFHLLGLVYEQVELDEFGSRVGNLAQTGNTG